jgi:hypothetical protein
MSSSSKRQQTIAKRTRELAVKERRARKQQKRQEKKRALADAQDAPAVEGASPSEAAGDAQERELVERDE